MRKINPKKTRIVLAVTLPAAIIITAVCTIIITSLRLPDPKIDITPPPAEIGHGGVISIGTRREVLWDDYLIDTEKTTAKHTLHAPQKQEPVLEMNEPWEGTAAGGFNIIEDGGIYRLYYITYDLPADEDPEQYNPNTRVCYAESADGLTWEKPAANAVKYGKSTANNILLYEKTDFFHSFFVFIDTNPEAPEKEKYKAIAVNEKDNRLLAYTSPDGLRWKKSRAVTKPVNFGEGFSAKLNTAFWDAEKQRYYCYFTQIAEDDRQEIYVTTSLNFKAWTEPQKLSYQSTTGTFNLPTANAAPYYRAPHVYIGHPMRATKKDGQSGSFSALAAAPARRSIAESGLSHEESTLTDTVFMTSRNGLSWDITEEAWLAPGAEHSGNWMYEDTLTATGMVETPSLHSEEGEDNELSIYAAEGKWSEGGTRLYRYTTRIDGFASYTAGYNTQKVVTKPFIFDGGRMLLNFSTSPNGYIFVRILDENGSPFPPVSYSDINGSEYSVPLYTSYEIVGDRVDREIAFNGDISQLNGRPIVLEFTMSDASIYSFKFDNQPYENSGEWRPSEIQARAFSEPDFYADSGAVNIGTRREVFWDNYIVDQSKTSAAHVTNPPARKEEMFKTDKPWEGNSCDYYNITIDEDENGLPLYRMYYLGWNNADETDIRVCYAYSHNGTEWIKPNLGIHSYYDEETGTTYAETNIILYTEEPTFDNFFVIKDPLAGVPQSERYKAVAQGTVDTEGNPDYGLWAWLSDDGIHWRKSHKLLPQIGDGESFDSVNTITWDEYTQQYFLFFRVKTDETVDGTFHGHWRKLMGCASADFFSWDPEAVYNIDYGSTSPNFEMYTNNVGKYYRADHIFTGFPTRFTRRSEWTQNYEYLAGVEGRRVKHDGGLPTASLSMTEALFMTSRDGLHWNRANESWLTPGPEFEANWIYGNCYPSYGLIETATENAGQDNELSAYVFEGKYYPDKPSTLYRYTTRIDGMACYKATYEPQAVTTKPFIFEGDELLLNFKTSAAGGIAIRFLDENGLPIEGYETEEIFGDRVDRAIPFKNSLAGLNGRAVVLEFTMSDAEIYSFKFN